MPSEFEAMLNDMDAFLSNGGEGDAAAQEAAENDSPLKVDVPKSVEQIKKKAAAPKKSAVEAATALIPKVSDVPVPTGGVGLLLFLILLIIFAIMPAPGQDGMSRLLLVWKAFIGQASLGNSAPAANATPSLGQQWAPGTNLPAIGNTQSGTWGNQWGGGFY